MTYRSRRSRSIGLSTVVLMLAGMFAAFLMLTGSASASEIVLGDADGDGDVTINDVTCIQRVLAELPLIGGFSEAAADIDGNGAVEIADATLIQQWLAEMQTPYPIGTPVTVPDPTTEPTIEPTTEATTQSPTDADGWGRIIFQP